MLKTAIGAALAACIALSGIPTTVEEWQAGKEWAEKPREMPQWYQGQAEWAARPYGYGTMADSGCGLVSAAMAASWLVKDELTPDELLDAVGSSCTTAGLNDMAKFGNYMAGAYGIGVSGRYHDPQRAIADAKAGAAVICSVPGRLGDSAYTGHIVVAYWQDGLRIADPASQGNSNRVWSEAEFAATVWAYFYTWTKEEM